MSSIDTENVAALAQAVQSTWRAPQAYQASQTVVAGDLRMEAEVRRVHARSLEIVYTHVSHPWSDAEALLSGFVEHTPAELQGMQFRYDSVQTWRYTPSSQTVVRSPGRMLFEPIPGIAFFGEFDFLAHLSRDYLLRDLGTATHAGHPVRRIGLKPKSPLRASLLSALAFPIQRATIDLDPETWFPVRVSWVPTRDSSAAALLGDGVTIALESERVRPLTRDAASLYAPPPDAREFEQLVMPLRTAVDELPFALPLAAIERLGWDLRGEARLTIDRERGRAHLTTHLPPAAGADLSARRSRLSITVGNYVSASMARWRTLISERGSELSGIPGVRILERRILWNELLPELDPQLHAPLDAFLQQDEVFWFLSLAGDAASLEILEQTVREVIAPSSSASSASRNDSQTTS